jgi:predicted NBD/HSP70 family sugar kinase
MSAHVRADADRCRCRCGNRGCLETIASITAVREQLKRAHVPLPTRHEDPSLATVAKDPIAARVITEAGRALGRVLADVCNCLNPQAIILGGELASAGEIWLTGVRESIDRLALPDIAAAVTIRLAELQLRSEVLGSAATAAQHARRLTPQRP